MQPDHIPLACSRGGGGGRCGGRGGGGPSWPRRRRGRGHWWPGAGGGGAAVQGDGWKPCRKSRGAKREIIFRFGRGLFCRCCPAPSRQRCTLRAAPRGHLRVNSAHLAPSARACIADPSQSTRGVNDTPGQAPFQCLRSNWAIGKLGRAGGILLLECGIAGRAPKNMRGEFSFPLGHG